MKQRFRISYWSGIAAFAGATCVGLEAHAEGTLPSLQVFLAASTRNAPDNREARALTHQRRAERAVAVDKLVPTFTATGSYTYNQYEAIAAVGNGTGGIRRVTITPHNQLEATLRLDVPILDLGNIRRIRAAAAAAEASGSSAAATEDATSQKVARAYYSLVGAYALVASTQRAVATSEDHLKTVRARFASGLSSDLDVHRARAEIDKNRQSVAEAKLAVRQSARALRALSGLDASGVPTEQPVDIPNVPPLRSFLAHVGDLPSVKAARDQLRAAEAQVAVQSASYFPSVTGSAQERFTNAPGFGMSPSWAAGVTATWRLDLGTVHTVRAEEAAMAAAAARLDRESVAVRNAIEDAYDQVQTNAARVLSARSEDAASQDAARVAGARYEAGTATQIDLLTAERDALSASVTRISAEADLAYAHFNLLLTSGHLRRVSE